MKRKLAGDGGEKSITKQFPWPVFSDEEINAVNQVVVSGNWGVSSSTTSPVAVFENEFTKYTEVKHALTTVNGSVALRIALIASGVKPGDEVIVPAMSFIATASIVIEANCVPVFVDIEPDTYNIDPNRIEEAITSRTKVIVPVHFAGHACDMDRIVQIAEKHNLTVIEDCCHAHGAAYKGKKLGTFGDAACFSFQASKNMTSGEGGIVITNNDALYEKIYALKNVGRSVSGKWYEHFLLGCNYRITQFQAAILSCQLKRLDGQNQRRQENATYLRALLQTIDGITPMQPAAYASVHAYHLFIFKYHQSKFNGMPKERMAELLIAEGVPCLAGYPQPLYKQPVFQQKNFMSYAIRDDVSYADVECPECEKACYEECMWISQNILLGSKEDMGSIANAIKKIKQHC